MYAFGDDAVLASLYTYQQILRFVAGEEDSREEGG